MATRTVYCTSFCNFGHVVETGRPVGHECHILPPAALRAEWAGRDGWEQEWDRVVSEKGLGPVVVGRG
jgi:hypothetical protein